MRDEMTNSLWPRETPALNPPEPLPTNFALYVNGRFGFQIGYPRSFQARPEPMNGDGRLFVSDDRKAFLEVCGWNTHCGQTLADEYYLTLTDLAGKIQYQRKGADQFEVAWVDAARGMFGYLKRFFGPGSQNLATILIPVTEKAKYESLLIQVPKSFRPGDLTECW
jgi:hypothetical protein